jgi:hypothetical protein
MVLRKTVWCQIYAWYVLSRSIMQFSSRKSWLLGIWYNKPSTSSLYKLAVADSFVLSGVVICAVAQLAPCTWPIVLSAGDELSRWLRLSAIKILLQYFQLLADEEIFMMSGSYFCGYEGLLKCSLHWQFDFEMWCKAPKCPSTFAYE